MDPAAHRLGSALCVASAIAFGAVAIFGKLAYDAGVGILTLLFVWFCLAAPCCGSPGWGGSARSPARRAGPCSPRSRSAPWLLDAVRPLLRGARADGRLPAVDAALHVPRDGHRGRDRPRPRDCEPPPLGRAAGVLGRAGARAARRGLGLVRLAGRRARLGAALTYTAYILVSDRVGGDLDALPLSALITTGAAITFGITCAASGSFDTGFASEGWLWLAAIAIVSTVTPIALFFAGLRRVGPSTAAILSTLEPPTTVALAFVVFGESLTVVQLAGAALVLGAAVSLQWRPRRRGPEPVAA